jgi:hypothetical protein
MTRMRLVIALGAGLGASCGDTTTAPLNQLNLERPVDISFACYGTMRLMDGSAMNGQIIETAQPTKSCDIRSAGQVPVGQEDGVGLFAPNWYGFILQSASGTVALSTFPAVPSSAFAANSASVSVLDADGLTPGKNAISVGEEPIAIATDASGCFEVTANGGSCDLSELDINSAITNTTDINVKNHPGLPVKVTRVPVKNAAGVPILARPAAMIAQPSAGAIGTTCGAGPQGLMYIAYPSCHLVAAIDVSTATMVAGIKFDATGVRFTDGNETCPAECSDGTRAPGAVTLGPRPVGLALDGGTPNRLAIAADNLGRMTVVDLDAAFRPTGTPLQIPLEDKTGGKLGLTSIAISPVIPMGGDTGLNNDDDTMSPPAGLGQYVYAVANDATVRVADVLNLRRECETQVDSRFARALAFNPSDLDRLQCLDIGAPDTPRRSGARSPGIELIGDVVPLSVAFFTAATPGDVKDSSQRKPALPELLIGHFAIISASNGAAYVVNVDDDNAPDNYETNVIHPPPGTNSEPLDPLRTQPPFIMPHQLRDLVANRGILAPENTASAQNGVQLCGDGGPSASASQIPTGGPRITAPPVRQPVPLVGESGLPVASDKQTELPFLHQVACIGTDSQVDPSDPTGATKLPTPISDLQFAADLDTRDRVFPDIRSLRLQEVWKLTWEGTLSLDTNFPVNGPAVREGQLRVDTDGIHLVDKSKPFCGAGVEPFDIVQLHGCNPGNGNSECPLGYECFVHPQSQVSGLGACMLTDEAERLAAACRDFLTTNRRYTVGRLGNGELQLLPRKRVLRTTPIDGCTSDQQCQRLANYAAQNASDRDPILLRNPDGSDTITDPHKWVCQRDDARAPVNSDPTKNARCIESCTTSADCDQGTICQNNVCMEGVVPPQACVNGPQRFDLRASEAFTVIGTRDFGPASGYVHPFIAQGDQCIRDPNASPSQVGRIPLKAPPCDPTADPITGKVPGGGFEPNPCSKTVPQAENQANYDNLAGGACTLGTPQIIPAERDAPAIQFRNRGMRLTLVDPYYPGDGTCILDRKGPFGAEKIPLVFPGYQISFNQTAGFAPLSLPTVVTTFPVKVVRGPTDSIWIVDNGDFLSTTLGAASTSGKVYRVESIAIGLFNLIQ